MSTLSSSSTSIAYAPATPTASNMVDTPASASQRPSVEVPKRHPASMNTRQVVKLYVGTDSDTEPHIVHKEWACHYSPVLRAALNSNFLEGQTQEYRFTIPKIGNDVVALFVEWIYTQKVNLTQINTSKGSNYLFEILIKLWILADQLMIPTLQNEVIEMIEKTRNEKSFMPIRFLNYIYENTAKESSLRRLFLAQCAAHLRLDSFMECSPYFPHEFLISLVVLMKENMSLKDKRKIRPSLNMSLYKVPEI